MYAFGVDLKVRQVSDKEVRLGGVDEIRTELVLKVTDELIFEYNDSRTVTGKEAADFVCCLTAVLSVPDDEDTIDHIAFAEKRKPSQ
jgi:hypothetical protein